MTAEEVKTILRRHHPGEYAGGMVGQWTCIEEWLGIDVLALNAWSKADVIGYEVKVSRGDLRRELLKPHKRRRALEVTTRFFLAVPEGLLTDEEIAYGEPEWEPEDFDRALCPGVPPFGPLKPRTDWGRRPYGGLCRKAERGDRLRTVPVPAPDVVVAPEWMMQREHELPEVFDQRVIKEHYYFRGTQRAVCWTCEGRGYLEKSRVEREAPMCWVPRDVGLVVVNSRGVFEVKRSPIRAKPKPIASSRKQLNDLVRWVSHRPDPRHR